MSRPSYIIATTPRSGSSLLGAALLQTGIAGKPQEYFHLPIREEFAHRRMFNAPQLRGYVQRIIEGSSTPNGVFGVKVHALQTENLVAKIEESLGRSIRSLKGAIDSVLPDTRYIFVSRKDTLAQAVSYYRALMTNEWWRFPGVPAPERDAHVEFDCAAISYCQMLIESSDQYWEEYFSHYGITPLRITYEAFVADYEGTVRAALEYLGLPADIVIPRPAMEKIADRRSNLWIEECKKREKIYSPEDIMRCIARWAPF